MYSDLFPSFLRQNPSSLRELRKHWRAYLLLADGALDSAFIKSLLTFIDTFQSATGSQVNLNDIVEEVISSYLLSKCQLSPRAVSPSSLNS